MANYFTIGFRVLNGIIFLLSILIWQFSFDYLNMNILIGLVIPTLFVMMWGHSHINRPFLSSMSFVFIIISIVVLPLNFENVILHISTLILILVISLILRPTFEYIGICMYLFYGFYLHYFIGYAGGWTKAFSGDALILLQESYHSLGWLTVISNVWWFILIAAYAIYLGKAALTKEFISMKVFHIVMSIFSLPFLLLPLVLVGFIYAIHKTVFSYATIFRDQVKLDKEVQEGAEQPAFEKYIFRKAFIDARQVMKKAFSQNVLNRKGIYQLISRNSNTYGKAINLFLSIVCYSAILTTLVVGNVLIGLATFAYFTILSIYSLPVFGFWAITYYSDLFFRKVNHISTTCIACYHTSDLPKYRCPSCKVEHTQLVPSKYGSLKRTCQCGHKIPVTFFNGRKDLSANCHNCSHRIDSRESTIMKIPVIGGPSVGKTSFILSAMKDLVDVANKKGWTLRFPKLQFKERISSYFKNLQHGVRPTKTQSLTPEADYFAISAKRSQAEKMIYLYDPAGAAFETGHDFKKLRYLEDYDGLVFVIDPFSIQKVRERYKNELNVNLVHPSYSDFENIFDRFLIEIQESYGIKAHEKIDKPIAIVINKIDQILKNEIGLETSKQLAASRDDIKDIADATHHLCKEYLAGVGMNNFLRKVENKLSNYRYFAYSSNKKEEVTNNGQPLIWILGEANKTLKI